MRVRMLRNAKGSPDGVNLYHYEAGHTYEVGSERPLPISEKLAGLFVAEEWAEDADGWQPASDLSAPAQEAPAEEVPAAEDEEQEIDAAAEDHEDE